MVRKPIKNPVKSKKKETHKMPDGTVMSGKTHNKNSKPVSKRQKPVVKKMPKAMKRAPY
tara:strand:+ start:4298 stop:4474 length:177 start_codon:yes stop_codon:yes gene_type:complete